MIQLDLKNVFSAGVEESEFQAFAKKLPEMKRDFVFCDILDDVDGLQKCQDFAEKVAGKFEHFVLLGMGGSALGVRAVTEALDKNMIILDSIDPQQIEKVRKSLDLEKTLFFVISKSGATLETLSQFLFFLEEVKASGLSLSEHFVCVTGKNGVLRESAQKENIPVFDFPDDLSGRFSVLSVGGLLPMAVMGVDVQKLVTGAKSMRELFLSNDFKENLPFQFAVLHMVSQKNNIVLMPYAECLSGFTHWWAQLLAESTGKINSAGNAVGFTPLPAMGARDQHSQLQLWAQGPADKLVIFLQMYTGGIHSFKKLIGAEMQATIQSLTELKRQNVILSTAELTEESLGELFFLFEGMIAFLGEFLEINVFDQMGVERGKELTRKNLSR